MTFHYSKRVKVTVLLLILIALSTNIRSNFAFLKKQVSFYPDLIVRDDITLHEKRLARLKKILPSHGVIGYITDKEPFPNQATKYRVIEQYYLTQYNLSPLIVVPVDHEMAFFLTKNLLVTGLVERLNNTQRKLVVGNFLDRDVNHEVYRERNLILLKDFGNGLMLFTRIVE